jgi:hypothetical protein
MNGNAARRKEREPLPPKRMNQPGVMRALAAWAPAPGCDIKRLALIDRRGGLFFIAVGEGFPALLRDSSKDYAGFARLVALT